MTNQRRWKFYLPFDFIAHQIVGSSNDNGRATRFGHSFKENKVPITNGFFFNFISMSQVRGVKDFFSFRSSQSCENSSSAWLSNFSEIILIDSSKSHNACFNQILASNIIHSLCGDDNCGSCGDNLFASFLKNLALLEPDFFKIFGVTNKDLNAHLESELIKIEVKTGDFGIFHHSWHRLRGPESSQSVSLDQFTLERGLTMRLKNIDVFDWVSGFTGIGIFDFDLTMKKRENTI